MGMTVPIASDSSATRVMVETRPSVRPRRPGANSSAVRAGAALALTVDDTAAILPEVPGRGERSDARCREPGSEQPQAVQGERWLGEGPDREPHEQQRVVLRGRAVEVDLATAGAAVDQAPLPGPTAGDGDGLPR